MEDIEQGKVATTTHPKLKDEEAEEDDTHSSKLSVAVGQSQLAGVTPPHESYEGYHRFDPTASWSVKEERAVVFKTDLMLLSWICLMFFGLQLDRGNLSNALTDNFLKDLNLSTNDYNNGTTIQLVCFLAAEFPVQLLTKRFGFKRVLPCMMMAWSLVSWTQAWMTSRAAFYVTRALIGACEGGFIPGAILFATYFYKTGELSVRLSFFWSTLNVARIISSLLAAGILQMRGVHGQTGWFWLFLIEGLLTFVIGLISFFYLPQSPTHTKSVLCLRSWYTEREEVIMINRLLRDDPSKGLTHIHDRATLTDILNAWSDKSMWGLYLIGLVAYIPQSPVQAYLSLTLKRLGFSTFDANMLSIPSAALQIILMLALSKSSDFFKERTFHCFIGELWSLPLLAALLALPAHGYNWGRFAITTMISGYPYFHPIVSSWISENTFDVKKRAITAATYNVIVQVGSVISSQIYRADDSPYYYRGNKVLISICVLSLIVFVAQREFLRHLNRQKERKWNAMSAEEKVLYQSDQEAREKEGNKRLDFRFKY
ncbi:putative MFS transporter [Aspergillus fischeri NRRL 181]|uniref:MFS transporter, putative n=1 Tax=Neosartorya fischeri (strain ATCC 1020 / DSM 3700 / CBS 544.65 / FGSC A1164 / JCM 1740 / NRRL 181 / WB 181) TaxID=331117 RepID=A1D151_NEOFI|nr:MFS transporter, putative [Aspergillus fischeri NRRL 181]EAW22144.1 MFS transporter, putative [Aspergillus fischeri NRRL 181]